MNKLFKKIALLAFLLWPMVVSAKEGIKLYDEPRNVSQRAFQHQSGQMLKLSDFKGDFVLALFWSRDCGPCVKELKSLNNFYKETSSHGVQLVLLSPSNEWDSVAEQKKFLKKYGAPDVPFYIDERGRLASDLGVYSRPHTVLINQNGQEIGRIRGSAKWDDPRVIDYIYKLKEKSSNS